MDTNRTNPGPPLWERLARLPDAIVATLLGLLVAALFFLLKPLADVPTNDDFAWARSAEAFARTGKIVYNGWGNPILLPHIVAGGVLIKLFGFSYVVLGSFGIISGAAFAGVLYLLARACHVRRSLSIFVVSLSVLNPVFIGVTPSFMSDVPSAFLYLCALLAFVRAAHLPGGETKYHLRPVPLAVATLFALLAGANRQILWAVIFVAFAAGFCYLAPADRVRRLLPALAAIALVAVALSLWFAVQPYSVPLSLDVAAENFRTAPELLAWYPYKFVAMIGLASLPVALPLAIAGWKDQKKPAIRFALCIACGVVPLIAFLVLPTPATEFGITKWRLTRYGQYATSQGVMVGGPSGYAARPAMIPGWGEDALNLVGAVGLGLILWCLVVTNRRRTFAANVLLAGSLAQILLPLPWFASGAIFDRYLVSLVPVLLITLTAPRRLGENTPVVAAEAASLKPYLVGVPFAALFAFGGIAFGVEYFGYTQARARLTRALRAQNIPPEQFDAGVEHSGDTQIAQGGFINNTNIKNPPGAYRPDQSGTCVFGAGYFPVMDARFLLSTLPSAPDLSRVVSRDPLIVAPDHVAKEEYYSPIAPHKRTIYVYGLIR